MKKHNIQAGDKVKLSGKFLRCTGQYTSDEARKVFKVTKVDGDFLVTDEKKTDDEVNHYFSAEELEKDPTLRFRRINAHNVIKVGKPDLS